MRLFRDNKFVTVVAMGTVLIISAPQTLAATGISAGISERMAVNIPM